MNAGSRHLLPLVLLAALAAGCAPKRPVLYPNETVENVGWAAAQRDIDECLAFAEAHGLRADRGGRTAASSAAGGVVGGASGAAAGAAWGAVRGGSVGNRAAAGAAAGAAGGATGGLLRGLFRWRDPDPIEARFVQTCLRRQGYEVIGWK
jgi:outer membrane lipoprotein SlyB